MKLYPFTLNSNIIAAAVEQAEVEVQRAGSLQKRIQERKTVGLGMIASYWRKIALYGYALEMDKEKVINALSQYANWQLTGSAYGDYINPKTYLEMLGAALLSKDPCLDDIKAFDKDRYTDNREKTSESEMLITEIIRLLVLSQDGLAQQLHTKLVKQFAREIPAIKIKYVSMPEIIGAILTKAQAEFDLGITCRSMDQENTFLKLSKEPKFDDSQYILDFPTLLLFHEAKKRGLVIKPEKTWFGGDFL